MMPSAYPTSPPSYLGGFGLGSPLFARRYSGDLVLISPPPPTQMFPFGGFAFPIMGNIEKPQGFSIGSPIRGSPDQRLPAPTRGLSQLATPFFAPQAEPSPSRRQRVE